MRMRPRIQRKWTPIYQKIVMIDMSYNVNNIVDILLVILFLAQFVIEFARDL